MVYSISIPTTQERRLSTRWQSYAENIRYKTLQLASLFNEPICRVRECYYRFYLLPMDSSPLARKVAKAAYLTLKIGIFAALVPLTAPLAILLRKLVQISSTRAFFYFEKSSWGKELPDNRQISLFAHNQCYMPGGYAISDGQVTLPSDKKRLDANIQIMREKDPDLILLFEVPDILDAEYIASGLTNHPFYIPVSGLRSIGPPSMIFVASKYRLGSIAFHPFKPGVELTGRARFSEKGFLTFDLINESSRQPVATVIATHLQHSELPQYPAKEEEEARDLQIRRIVRFAQNAHNLGKKVIFAGDLNQEERELLPRLVNSGLERDKTVQNRPTWGGDSWAARLMNKRASSPLTLDYTFATNNCKIQTTILDNGYRGEEFLETALSDHNALLSTITI